MLCPLSIGTVTPNIITYSQGLQNYIHVLSEDIDKRKLAREQAKNTNNRWYCIFLCNALSKHDSRCQRATMRTCRRCVSAHILLVMWQRALLQHQNLRSERQRSNEDSSAMSFSSGKVLTGAMLAKSATSSSSIMDQQRPRR